MVVKADWTLVEVDHNYNKNMLEKIKVDKTILLLPCGCSEVTSDNNKTNVNCIKAAK